MRLVKLELQDFQGHETTIVPFGPTITTIRGPTDAGKSAILRALRWLCLNDLAGDSFVREGSKRAIVRLTVDIGEHRKGIITQQITRIKSVASTGVNTYELDDKEFKAFGAGVPRDIVQLLALNELNFQSQHDAPFWFDETAGEVSKRLNAVVDLSVIDSALSYIAGQVRITQEKVNFSKERLAQAKESLGNLEVQRPRVEEFGQIKERHEKLETLSKDRDRLGDLLTRIDSRAAAAKQLAEQRDDGDAVLELARAARRVRRQEQALDGLIGGLVDLNRKAVAPPDFNPVESARQQWQGALDAASVLGNLIDDITAARTSAQRKADKAKQLEDDFHEQIKGMECPTCQTLIQ